MSKSTKSSSAELLSIINSNIPFNSRLMKGGAKEEIDAFVSSIPRSIKDQIRSSLLIGDKDTALKLSCQYTVKFFDDVTYEHCHSHADFVYELLRASIKN